MKLDRLCGGRALNPPVARPNGFSRAGWELSKRAAASRYLWQSHAFGIVNPHLILSV